eukprot:Amastigsp_a345778_30.p4 type:complete len:125 gc:universal Amastigsp_a345778_30:124-498(+)
MPRVRELASGGACRDARPRGRGRGAKSRWRGGSSRRLDRSAERSRVFQKPRARSALESMHRVQVPFAPTAALATRARASRRERCGPRRVSRYDSHMVPRFFCCAVERGRGRLARAGLRRPRSTQ